jgi:hypothetical protein
MSVRIEQFTGEDMGLFSSLIENCFDGMSLDRYKGTLQLRDALLDLQQRHDYQIIRYGKGRASRDGIYNGLSSDDDIDNALQVIQEIRDGKKIIHIMVSLHFDNPNYKALVNGEISKGDEKKYFNFIWLPTNSKTTSTGWLEYLLKEQSRMLYEQKDD